ncbi:putative F-box domain, galactose oxidase/kelch, beta-propeller, F-box associated interaction [Medicago truncatula]|uniref:Putative F-box domain, galactose oxidase/kelch, beta-propeller, F-box associated interaction n=1 Tax=Medicago truncatula TaxID=3880 RepID=A0A396JND8_MEDTR|nr:F-box/kelch-repeat protein At3g06240-like [Medicago truncatula]RHN78724.1 putative F-box domain, galactose oxidase/kelch, beta-propeller, F-box associated interaction [Medicago truncatula]
MALVPNRKKVSCTSSYIHDDIAFGILSKLPIKSLKRFTCVRKSWSLLFQSPNFIQKFRNNLVTKSHSPYDDDHDDDVCFLFIWVVFPSLFYSISGEKFENEVKLDLPPQFDNTFHLVLGSSINGILCVYDHVDHSNVALWNPTTGENKVIPPRLSECLPNFVDVFHLRAFGYDHVTDDYKVIQHVSFHPILDGRVREEDLPMTPDPFWEIYSLRSNSWRRLVVDMPVLNSNTTNVYLNGMCHWFGLSDGKTFSVVSYNLSNEMFFTTPVDCHARSFSNLMVLNGYIALTTKCYDDKFFNISVLGEIGVKESWTKLFEFGSMPWIDLSLDVWMKGKIFLSQINGKVACFDLTTEEVIEEIDFKGDSKNCLIVPYKKNFGTIGEVDN